MATSSATERYPLLRNEQQETGIVMTQKRWQGLLIFITVIVLLAAGAVLLLGEFDRNFNQDSQQPVNLTQTNISENTYDNNNNNKDSLNAIKINDDLKQNIEYEDNLAVNGESELASVNINNVGNHDELNKENINDSKDSDNIVSSGLIIKNDFDNETIFRDSKINSNMKQVKSIYEKISDDFINFLNKWKEYIPNRNEIKAKSNDFMNTIKTLLNTQTNSKNNSFTVKSSNNLNEKRWNARNDNKNVRRKSDNRDVLTKNEKKANQRHEILSSRIQRYRIENNLLSKDIQPKSAVLFHQKFLKSDPRVYEISLEAIDNEYNMKAIRKYFEKRDYYCSSNKSRISELNSWAKRFYETKCDFNSIYRTFDGTCNNFNKRLQGAAFTPYIRLLPTDYFDEISEPRRAKSGDKLPSARLLSTKLSENKFGDNSNFTLLLMLWGLFIDHDLTSTASSKLPNNKPIACCHQQITLSPNEYLHPECFIIEIQSNDHHYSKLNQTCMDFVRSAPVIQNSCESRQQLNQITSYLDASAVYGSSLNEIRMLREFQYGKLLSSRLSNHSYLPINYNEKSTCGNTSEHIYCFRAGDSRANEQIYLLMMHTIWMREHNRLANELSNLNPNWTDEKIFQEARKILIAELQHITYNEYLPIILSKQMMKKINRKYRYDENVDSTLSNVFASAAFRFGHSQVQNLVKLMSNLRNLIKEVNLRETFFNPQFIYQFGLDEIIYGLFEQASLKTSTATASELRDHLFEPKNKDFSGLDITSLTIQRGRDHGLPGYLQWLTFCKIISLNKTIVTWKDLKELNLINDNDYEVLSTFYEQPQDIDLIVGALSEKLDESVNYLPPTLNCLIGEQFYRMKFGDRFWHETKNSLIGFTQEQLNEIKKVTLSRILCDNSENIKQLPKFSFHKISEKNPLVSCDNEKFISKLNLSYWKK